MFRDKDRGITDTVGEVECICLVCQETLFNYEEDADKFLKEDEI